MPGTAGGKNPDPVKPDAGNNVVLIPVSTPSTKKKHGDDDGDVVFVLLIVLGVIILLMLCMGMFGGGEDKIKRMRKH